MIQHTQSQRADALADYTDTQILEELLRRFKQREHEQDTAKALEILREIPEALSPKWTINKLCNIALEHGLSASAAFTAWEQLTAPAPSKPVSSTATVVESAHGYSVGDRVAFQFDDQHTGTVTGAVENEIRVRWDRNNLVTPVDPAELMHSKGGN
ncbi:hypothetical protein [Glutamicibacter uratoxydans]|uniref:hypothetical protein n=1 Tax=Glutamicibacter uratoxydans TaxID=43667 RepID=UPI003D6DBB00